MSIVYWVRLPSQLVRWYSDGRQFMLATTLSSMSVHSRRQLHSKRCTELILPAKNDEYVLRFHCARSNHARHGMTTRRGTPHESAHHDNK